MRFHLSSLHRTGRQTAIAEIGRWSVVLTAGVAKAGDSAGSSTDSEREVDRLRAPACPPVRSICSRRQRHHAVQVLTLFAPRGAWRWPCRASAFTTTTKAEL